MGLSNHHTKQRGLSDMGVTGGQCEVQAELPMKQVWLLVAKDSDE